MDLHIILKATTGVVIVPLSILSLKLWPWWEKAPLPEKILTAPFVLPIVGLAALAAPWWNGF